MEVKMRFDINSIKNPQVRVFYSLWWPQHQVIYDFYSRLAEEQFDYCMVDTPEKKSDTPRQSLAHILYVLFFLRDHDILHVGWNLALMDHLSVPRFESLIAYW